MRAVLPLLALLLSAVSPQAQTPSGVPSGSTGMCKDGTYTSAKAKFQACSGHKGVQQWYADATGSAAQGAPPAMPVPGQATSAPAAMPAPTPARAASTRALPAPVTAAAALGGGPGTVWVNTPTNVYHCPGDRFYGKTKSGKYMSESEAKAAGAKPDKGRSCSK